MEFHMLETFDLPQLGNHHFMSILEGCFRSIQGTQQLCIPLNEIRFTATMSMSLQKGLLISDIFSNSLKTFLVYITLVTITSTYNYNDR